MGAGWLTACLRCCCCHADAAALVLPLETSIRVGVCGGGLEQDEQHCRAGLLAVPYESVRDRNGRILYVRDLQARHHRTASAGTKEMIDPA